jgi:hypothetical protein
MTYTCEFDIGDVVDAAIDDILGEFEEAVDNIRKYRPAKVVHQQEIDIDEVLAEHHAIAIVWDIRHVKDQRPDLSDAQAWQVLQECRQDKYCFDRYHDAMREMILDSAEKLFPPRRQIRSSKAAEVIASYGGGDERENLVDLLSDMMLWCDSFGEPFEEFYGTARLHFDEERKTTTLKGE